MALKPPFVPVIVNVKVPLLVRLVVATVSVEVPVPPLLRLIAAGLNEPVL